MSRDMIEKVYYNDYSSSVTLKPEEAFAIVARGSEILTFGQNKVSRFEVEHIYPQIFHDKFGLSSLVNFYITVGDFICERNGKVSKKFIAEYPDVVEWYKNTGKYINMVYAQGVNRDTNPRKPKDGSIRHQVNPPTPPEMFVKSTNPPPVDKNSSKKNSRTNKVK